MNDQPYHLQYGNQTKALPDKLNGTQTVRPLPPILKTVAYPPSVYKDFVKV